MNRPTGSCFLVSCKVEGFWHWWRSTEPEPEPGWRQRAKRHIWHIQHNVLFEGRAKCDAPVYDTRLPMTIDIYTLRSPCWRLALKKTFNSSEWKCTFFVPKPYLKFPLYPVEFFFFFLVWQTMEQCLSVFWLGVHVPLYSRRLVSCWQERTPCFSAVVTAACSEKMHLSTKVLCWLVVYVPVLFLLAWKIRTIHLSQLL